MRNRVLPRVLNRSIQPPIQNLIEIGISHSGNLQCLKNSRIVVQMFRAAIATARSSSGPGSAIHVVPLAVHSNEVPKTTLARS
jgi:hypothetical protein